MGRQPAAAHGWRHPGRPGPHVRGSVDSAQPYQASAPSDLCSSQAQEPSHHPGRPGHLACARGVPAEAYTRVPARPPRRSRPAPALPSTPAPSSPHPGAPAPTSSRPPWRAHRSPQPGHPPEPLSSSLPVAAPGSRAPRCSCAGRCRPPGALATCRALLRPGPARRAASRTSGRAARRALHAGRCLPAPSGCTHPRAPAPAGRRLGPAPPGFPLPRLRRAAPGFPTPRVPARRPSRPRVRPAPPSPTPAPFPPLPALVAPRGPRSPPAAAFRWAPLLRGSHVVAPKPRREREAPHQKRGWDRLRWWRRGAALGGVSRRSRRTRAEKLQWAAWGWVVWGGLVFFFPVPSRHLPAHPPRLPSSLAGRRGPSLGGLSLRAVGHAGATLPPSGAPPGRRRPVHPETHAAPRRAPSLSSLRQSRGAVGGSQAGRPRRVNSLGQGGEVEIVLEISQWLGFPAAWLARGTSLVHRFGDLDRALSREMDQMLFL